MKKISVTLACNGDVSGYRAVVKAFIPSTVSLNLKVPASLIDTQINRKNLNRKNLSCCLLIALISYLAPAQHSAIAATPVFATVVKNVFFTDEVEALGTLKSNENIEIMSTVTERVTKINFRDGQRVNKGDVLIEMDAAEEIAQRVEEQSRIDEALKQRNRLQSLFKRDIASAAALDETERNLLTARARLKAIESRIKQHLLTAPFDGVVGLRNISVGALAQPGIRIATLDDNRVMKLDFSVPEVFLATLATGASVQARTRIYPNEMFEGIISSIDTRIDPVTRAVIARALLDNDHGRLKAGMLMRVVIHKNPRQAIVIPEEAVINRGAHSLVLLIDESDEQTIAVQQAVTLGARRKGEVEILSGLEIGQKIVSHGITRVKPGGAVVIKAIATDNESLTELLGDKVNPSRPQTGNKPQ